MPKSKAVPGVLGVLVAEPKEANAPEPKPKAVDAPEVGDAMLPVANGGMALKGLDLPPWDDVPPLKRVRGGCSLLGSLCSDGFMERESLEVLQEAKISMAAWKCSGQKAIGMRREREAHFERRVHRFSLSRSIENLVEAVPRSWRDEGGRATSCSKTGGAGRRLAELCRVGWEYSK